MMPALSNDEMRALTEPLRTKADKIRVLGRAGASAGDIGRFLRIRYQHAYNVLKRAGIPVSGAAGREPGRAGSTPTKTVLDASGSIRIPRAVLEAWNVSPGDELLVRLDDGELRMLTRNAGARRARDILRKYAREGQSMAEELIAERRREAGRNDG